MKEKNKITALLSPIILFEDKNYLVLNKPAGLVVHPGPGHHHGKTLVELLQEMGKSLSTLGEEERPGLVHRLDKDTSGVMVVAKTNAAHAALAKQFNERTVKKEYIALVHGILEPKEGSIEAPLSRGQKNRTKIQVTASAKGRYALTHYRVEKFFQFPFPASLLRVTIETGRTHQIRVHFEAIGHPLVGDPVYSKRQHKALEEGLGLGGQFLHAARLEFESPTTHKRVAYEAEWPGKFEKMIGLLTPPPSLS